jgi:hypothetical protein
LIIDHSPGHCQVLFRAFPPQVELDQELHPGLGHGTDKGRVIVAGIATDQQLARLDPETGSSS